MQDFKYDGDENGTFHPYVLDIIRSIVIDHQSIETDLSEFSSHYLRNKIKNDYVIFRICDRERKRVGQINIDEQVSFFIYMAVYKRGNINKNNFNNEIISALKNILMLQILKLSNLILFYIIEIEILHSNMIFVRLL